MSEKFNTRDVSKKEIYDSYMGILRISPNVINGSEIDDPTQLLNTLYDEDKKKRTEVNVSDSDGNILPITFQPKAFEQKVLRKNVKLSVDTYEQADIINISTIIGDASGTLGNLYVSNTLKCRSTLLVSRPNNDVSIKHPNVKILNGGKSSNSNTKIQGKGWLLYPSESPNDKNYFNDKNKHGLFNPEDTTLRYKQVENSLYKKTRKWHDTNIDAKERVHVGGKIVSQLNLYNEEIPLYYTHDYILGHYDGHQIISGDTDITTRDSWGISKDSSEGEVENITKLSWTRFDKLIWESLHEVLAGNIRHIAGRYDGMAIKEASTPGIRDVLGFGNSERYKEFAPLLGTEMARGIVGYHAMPFHRYWFHRTRQALRAFIERRKEDDTLNLLDIPEKFDSLDDYVISQNLAEFLSQNDKQSKFENEILKLQEFFNNDLITPAPMGTLGFSHSLSKNFLICNGNTVNFKNFPNISLTNDLIFDTSVKSRDREGNEIILTDDYGNLIKGGIANFDKDTKVFKYNDLQKDTDSIGYALLKSLGGDNIKLPNLFALYEKTPRFIRGLNWKNKDNVEGDSDIVTIHPTSNTEKINYVDSDTRGSIPNSNEIVSNGDKKYGIRKNITKTDKCYFHTYSNLDESEEHQHYIFSSNGGKKTGNYSGTRLHNYHCKNTRRGGDGPFCWLWHTFTNYDITYSRKDANSYTITTYHNRIESDNKIYNGAISSNSFMKYCLGECYLDGSYSGFNPIPNQGLWLFNASIFNNAKVNCAGKHRGTSTQYTNYVDNDIEGINEKSTLKNNIFFMDAKGDKHYLKDEAPISLGDYNSSTTTTENMKKHDEEKQRRKFYAMKMNEAEGFIPISVQGKAQGQIVLSWSRSERSGCKGRSRNTYDDYKSNIAGYKAAEKNADEVNSTWRCLTSIPYNNPYKLGVGDIKNYMDNKKNYDDEVDFYDVNCVTQMDSKAPYKQFNFGGITLNVDESCPTPNHMNLLPLIRI